LLEQSARLLYKEWFVHLRFPGHEHVKIKDGVPEGWEKLTYSDVFEFQGGFAFKSKTYQVDGKYGIVTIKNVHDASFVSECSAFLDAPPEKMKEYCLLKTGDVLLSLTGNVGRACVVYGENYLLNQRVAKIVGKPSIPRSFVYWTFSNDDTQNQLENLSYGVAQLNLSPVKLGSREFVKPSPTVLTLFSEIAEPIHQQITTLNLQIEQLAKARDLLLPRLMSGEIAA
jgi:type I restriction enzyme S subunit